MSDPYGSTTGAPTPDSEDTPVSSSDAWSQVDQSAEELAEQERQDAYRSDIDAATYHDRVDEGRFHSRSEGDRSETGWY
jgi:hypothetical protein